MNSRATPPVLFIQPGHPPSGSERLLPVRAAYAALASVVVFFALQVYWYLGGSSAGAGQLPGLPNSVGGWVFEVVVVSAVPLGAWVTLAIARGWPHGKMPRADAIVVGSAARCSPPASPPGLGRPSRVPPCDLDRSDDRIVHRFG